MSRRLTAACLAGFTLVVAWAGLAAAQAPADVTYQKPPKEILELVEDVAELDGADASLVFGEALPPGLRLVD